jgi:dihydroorotase
VPAIEQGFLPDSISTDLHSRSMIGPAQSMTNVMSKFLAMGLSLEDVIRCSTVNPARQIRRPDLGALSPGSEADIAVLEKLEGEYSYADNGNARMSGRVKLIARMTLRAGNIVFDPSGLSMVDWREARKRYYKPPRLQSSRPSTADDYPRA